MRSTSWDCPHRPSRELGHHGTRNGVFYAWTVAGPDAKLRCLPDERRGMALFRRKATVEDEPERCPVCRERLPDDAHECAMCGADLKPLRPSYERRVGQPVERDQRTTGPRPIA